MKLEKINDTDYLIFVIKSFYHEDEINFYVKEFLNKFKNKLKLSGFYKIIVYNRYFGLFLKLIQIESSYYKDTFDYRIVFDNDSDFYFKTDDYFIVSDCRYIYYFDGYFYALVDDSFDDILEKVEFGLFGLESDFDISSKIVIVK